MENFFHEFLIEAVQIVAYKQNYNNCDNINIVIHISYANRLWYILN